jgi:hypothetical protein
MILLLDIDGVMVPQKSWKQPEILEDGFPAFSSNAVEALNNLIVSDTIIFITSSHKSRYSLKEWQAIFLKRGVKYCPICVLPENINKISRKDEILNWLKNQTNISPYLILDDDTSLLGMPKNIKNSLVITSPMIGLRSIDLVGISIQ